MPKERSLTSSPPPLKEPPKNIKKIPPTPPSKPTEKEAEALQTSPLLKQRPIPPKRPLKPRASTDAPVAAPRPVPTPRRAGGKDITKSPLREVDEIMNDKTNVLEPPVVSNINTESQEHVESQKDDTEIIDSKMNEKAETIEEEGAEAVLPEVTTDNGLANTDTVSKNRDNNEASPTPPSNVHIEELNLPMEETIYQKSVSEGTCPKSPNASSTDEYEHMRPGVTKDKSNSPKETVKSPEYEEPEEWNLESPKEINGGGYATPCPVPKKEEAAYDMPVTPIKVDLKTLPPAPQVPVLATVNEEKLTAGRGKSPPLPRSSTGEDQLKPFQMERDALGVSVAKPLLSVSIKYITCLLYGKEQCM